MQNIYYQVSKINESNTMLKYDSLEDAIINIYQLLNYDTKTDFDNILLNIVYYHNIVTTFYLMYKEGSLFLHNDDNFIKISSMYPQFLSLDNIFKMDKPKLSNNLNKNNKLNTPQKKSDNHRHQSLLKKSVTPLVNTKPVNLDADNKVSSTEKSFDENFELLKEKQRCDRINHNKNIEKFKVFYNDKVAYTLVKNDIETGLLHNDNINPAFVLKYKIFKILESRDNINFNDDDNITEEYNLFNELYDVCLENEEEEEIKEIKKIYIPHNYYYMTNDKKEEHAKKYKMTMKEFEDKYINSKLEDDVIENHINTTKESTKPFSPNDNNTVNELSITNDNPQS